MELLFKLLVCFFAGAGAGIGTGFAGMSAAAIIGPILMTFMDVSPFQAVGIGLASDVFASAISAYTYYKNKNLDIKNSMPLFITVIIMTVVGSFVGSFFPPRTLGNFMQFGMIALGISFFFRKPIVEKPDLGKASRKKKIIKSILFGILIGFICGFVGAGGGIMLLMALTSVLGYRMHMAVGTSVFIMTFTAFAGCMSHFRIAGMPDMVCLIGCMLFTFIFARISAVLANKTNEKTINKIVGIVIFIIGIVIWIVNATNS